MTATSTWVGFLFGFVLVICISLGLFVGAVYYMGLNRNYLENQQIRQIPCIFENSVIEKIKQRDCNFTGAIRCVNQTMNPECFMGLRGNGLGHTPANISSNDGCCNCDKNAYFFGVNLTSDLFSSGYKYQYIHFCKLMANERGASSFTSDRSGISCNPATIISEKIPCESPDLRKSDDVCKFRGSVDVGVANTPSVFEVYYEKLKHGQRLVCYEHKNGAVSLLRPDADLMRNSTDPHSVYYAGQFAPISLTFAGLGIMVVIFGIKGIIQIFREVVTYNVR